MGPSEMIQKDPVTNIMINAPTKGGAPAPNSADNTPESTGAIMRDTASATDAVPKILPTFCSSNFVKRVINVVFKIAQDTEKGRRRRKRIEREVEKARRKRDTVRMRDARTKMDDSFDLVSMMGMPNS